MGNTDEDREQYYMEPIRYGDSGAKPADHRSHSRLYYSISAIICGIFFLNTAIMCAIKEINFNFFCFNDSLILYLIFLSVHMYKNPIIRHWAVDFGSLIKYYVPSSAVFLYFILLFIPAIRSIVVINLNMAFEDSLTIGVTVLLIIAILLTFAKRAGEYLERASIGLTGKSVSKILNVVYTALFVMDLVTVILMFRMAPSVTLVLDVKTSAVIILAGIIAGFVRGLAEFKLKSKISDIRIEYNANMRKRYFISIPYLLGIGLGITLIVLNIIARTRDRSVDVNGNIISLFFILLFIFEALPFILYLASMVLNYCYTHIRKSIWASILSICALFIVKIIIFNSNSNVIPDWADWMLSGIIALLTWLILARYGAYFSGI